MHRHVSSPELEELQGSLCVLKVTEEMTVQKDKKKKLLAFRGQSCKYFSVPSLSPEGGRI